VNEEASNTLSVFFAANHAEGYALIVFENILGWIALDKRCKENLNNILNYYIYKMVPRGSQ
jgi:hypothetical protein